MQVHPRTGLLFLIPPFRTTSNDMLRGQSSEKLHKAWSVAILKRLWLLQHHLHILIQRPACNSAGLPLKSVSTTAQDLRNIGLAHFK